MTNALDGLTVLVPESRELDLFVAMLEAEGAVAWRCPLVRILDLQDSSEAEVWIEQFVAGVFQDVVWLTGEGLRRLLTIVDRSERRSAFVEAFGRVRSITRGPKPARVLRELSLAPGLAAVSPTSQGVLDALAGEAIAGRTIGVQLYPGASPSPLLNGLQARGATIFPVTPYRYASETATEEVMDAIRGLMAGRIGMIAFTASPQVERLVAVARESGIEAPLRETLRGVQIAAVGPLVEQTLRRHDLTASLHPETGYHLKPLVRAIVAAWSAR